MRASRLLSILLLLQLRGRMTAEALAEEFEVSVRTIHRDIDQLSAAGVPVFAERGRAGGFALHAGYRTKLTGLTSGEAQALFFSGAGTAAADLGLGDELIGAQLKLLASLPPEQGARTERLAARFHLDPAHWYARDEAPPHLEALASAVWNALRVRIIYESWNRETAATLDPLGLILKGGVWYLVAATEGKPLTYRVSNIKDLIVTEAPSKRPAKFNLQRYWRGWVVGFEARILSERARVRLTPEGLRRLREVSAAAAAAADEAQSGRDPAAPIEADIPIESGAFAIRQLLSLGSEVEVLAPPALRSALAETARRIAKTNG